MKGNNSLTLCEAQMQVIVQEWIDRNVSTRPLVKAVKYNGGSSHSFEVTLSDEPRAPSATDVDDSLPRVGDLCRWIGEDSVARVKRVDGRKIWARWDPTAPDDTFLMAREVRIIERARPSGGGAT